MFLWKDVLTFYINVLKITHLAQNVKYFSYLLDDSFSQLFKEVCLLCWDSRKSKQRKWSDVFQKIQVDINFILICGTKVRTFKQKVRPQWILLWCIFMWKKLGTNLSTPWKIYLNLISVYHVICEKNKRNTQNSVSKKHYRLLYINPDNPDW